MLAAAIGAASLAACGNGGSESPSSSMAGRGSGASNGSGATSNGGVGGDGAAGGPAAGRPNSGGNPSTGGGDPGPGGESSGGGPSGGSGGALGGGGIGGYKLAGDLEIVDLPTCDAAVALPCNGACVTRDAETNGCQFIASATIFTDSAQDGAGRYLATVGGSNAAIATIDATGTGLMNLTTHPGGNLHIDLTLTADSVYYVVPGTPETLWRASRNGGMGALVKDGIPNPSSFAISDEYVFIDELFETRLHRIALDAADAQIFERSTDSLRLDGNDLYFLQAAAAPTMDLYRAPNGDVDAAELLSENVRGPVLGFDETWVYAIVYRPTDSGRHVYRIPKTGGAGEPIVPLGSVAVAALVDDFLIFTHSDGAREFVNTIDLDGTNRTIVGYLPGRSPYVEFLVADATFVYATKGFVMARFRR